MKFAVAVLACSMTLTAAARLKPDATVSAQAPDADAHKAWMNDATDLQEDIRDAMRAQDGAKIADAATKIEALMAKTEAYWSAKKAADVVTLAQTARSHAKDVATLGKAGKFDQSNEAFGKLNTTCNTCHDLHPEKR
ncbi:MAG: hypothetical protein LAO77_09960 [Acidobacteriia bacterium]|nr:hypothetical protein [Terriglobia bacterium]